MTLTRRSADEVRDAVLAATSAILREVGLSGLTMDEVAARAEVAKTTIYRRWSNRELLVVDAFLSTAPPYVAVAETGCAEAAIRAHMIGFASALAGDHGRSVRESFACGILSSTVTLILFNRYVPALRAPVAKALCRGVRDGTFRPDLNGEAVADALLGPILFRTLVSHAPLDVVWVEAVADAVFAGCRAPSERRPRPSSGRRR